MKNIFLLPTDKPSYLYKDMEVLFYNKDFIDIPMLRKNQHIYITSDEEIKEGDWCYDDFLKSVFQANSIMGVKTQNTSKKIILTTDQDLIVDGVQPIDDEFLEWFVENPSCKIVEVEKKSRCCGRCNGVDDLCYTDVTCDKHQQNGCEECYGKRVEYEIIIPQEEPKTGSLGESIQEVTKDLLREINELKQETLEEIPKELEPILAKISHINDLGLSQWYEVVYYADDKWCSYSDSKTFEDGERVIDWKYCKEQFKNK
jgi:hypothetical protein